jgi:arsenate reductase
MKKILVLCSGNACRSQMAEAYLRFFTNEEINIFSAGLNPHAVNPYAVDAMREDNIDISQATSKDISTFAGQHFDYLLWVCPSSKEYKKYNIQAGLQCHYEIPDPESLVVENDELDVREVFSETRELVKKEILRFIGKYLELPVSSGGVLY